MRTINKNDVGEKLKLLLDEKNPIEEDIKILDEKGNLSSVIITNEAYKFFLRKVEEQEDKIDNKTVDDFHKSGEMNNEK